MMKTTFAIPALPLTKMLFLLAGLLLSLTASAVQNAAPYTAAVRYSMAGLVTGTISPDPDDTGTLGFPATRTTYTDGLPTKVETGTLAAWQNETIAPASWSGFTVLSTQLITYDDRNRKTQVETKDKNAVTDSLVQYRYDELNRLQCKAVRMSLLAGSDACAPGTEGSFGPDRITRYTYNNLDQLVKEERAVGTPLAQNYVINEYSSTIPGNPLIAITDANNNRTQLEYYDDTTPQARRLKRMYFPSKTTPNTASTTDYEEYTYDANGNKTILRKRSGALVKYTYDNLNRPILKDLADNTKDVTYSYDLRGLQTLAAFGTAATAPRIETKYDGFGNITTSTNAMGATPRVIYYKYDLDNNRIQVKYTADIYFTYGFDGLDRFNVVTEGSGTRIAYLLYGDDGHRRLIQRRGNGANTTYNYTDATHLDSFTQDLVGTANDLTNTFQYNPANQITQLNLGSALYYYSGNTNRTGQYEVNGLNQYSKIAGQPLGYDANANLTNDGTFVYTYDDENRLLTASGNGNTASFIYDPMGRLYQSTINGTITQFLYDGDALVGEFDNAGNQTRRYVHGDRVDEPLLQYNGSAIGYANWRYLLADHQGSIIAHTDQAGNLLNALSYDSFGIPAASNIDRFGYTGQIWFKELGLFHYKARMYSPKLGRFLQTDPIGYDDDYNLYSYAGNDPFNNTDPSGEECVTRDTTTCEKPPEPPPTTEQTQEIIVKAERAREHERLDKLEGDGIQPVGIDILIPELKIASIGTIGIKMLGKESKKYRPKTRGANKKDKKQVDDAAKAEGVEDRDGFGDFIHEEKEALGRGASDNFSYSELRELAKKFKESGGS